MFKVLKRRKIKKKIDAALADSVLTEDEVAGIMGDSDALQIDGTETKALLVEKLRSLAHQKLQPIIDRAHATNRFSPDDEAEMRAIAKNLKLTFDTDLSPLAPQRFLWAVENGEPVSLEPIHVDVFLAPGEQCFHVATASWRQIKTVRKNHGYVGSSVSFRIAKGVRFSLGRAIPISGSNEEMVTISNGQLYVTNQRLLFVGDNRSTEAKLGGIVNIEWYSDGCEVMKSRGKPDFYITDGLNAELIHAKLALIMNRA